MASPCSIVDPIVSNVTMHLSVVVHFHHTVSVAPESNFGRGSPSCMVAPMFWNDTVPLPPDMEIAFSQSSFAGLG